MEHDWKSEMQEQQALRVDPPSAGQISALEEALQAAVNNESDQAQSFDAAAAELDRLRTQMQSGAQVAL